MTAATNFGELVLQAKDGNQEAWEELYQATVKEAYFVALKVSGDQEEALDLVQDAYLTAWQKLGQLQEPEKFRYWFNMIVANRCRDHLKKKKPALFTDIEKPEGPEIDWADERETAVPELVLDHQETVRLVAEMIEALPEEQRLCVLLYYQDELSVAEIAQALQISEGTVKSRLNYARKRIKEKVEDLEKQGTKLYGVSPLPLVLWLLRQEVDALEVPAALMSGRFPMAVGITTEKTGSIAAVTGKAAVGSVKGMVAGVGTKIVAGCLAAGVLAGGVGLVLGKDGSNPKAHPQESAAQTEYQKLLERGRTANKLNIRYYTYLDLNQDGLSELLVANNTGRADTLTVGELYRYEDGEAKRILTVDAYFTDLALVNGSHIIGKDIDHGYETMWGLDNGLSWDDITTREPIELQPNELRKAKDRIFESPHFTIPIPWFGYYSSVIKGEGETVKSVRFAPREDENATLLYVELLPEDAELPLGGIDCGISTATGTPMRVVALHPQDIWYNPGCDDVWSKMAIDVWWVIDNIVVH